MIRTLLTLAGLALSALPAGAIVAQGNAPQVQKPGPVDEIDKLRAQLAQPGPDGTSAREVAIERLLSLKDERAHALLRERLANGDDPDGVRGVVLQALARRLGNPADPVFGLREDAQELRDGLLRAYAGALATFWQGKVDIDGLLPPDPLRQLARTCLVSLPAAQLEQGLRAVLTAEAAPPPLKLGALRAASDAQNLHLCRLLADYLEAADPDLQRTARSALRYLTFTDQLFENRAQFEAWFAQSGGRTYLQLAEEAGRSVARRARQQREALQQIRRDAAAEYVATVTERRTNGINWAQVQARTLGDDPETTRACLEKLQGTLADAALDDKNATQRLQFARILLLRAKGSEVDDIALRAAMLEVAAYLCRPGEADLAVELRNELVAQLHNESVEMQLASLRGLRRFPSAEARAEVVALAGKAAAAADAGDAASGPMLAQALQTLAWKGENPWRAPGESSPERQPWLELVRKVSMGNFGKDRRRDAMAVALLPDKDNKRVPEVFDLLVDLARDGSKEPEFRTQSLIYLQDWRDQGRADVLVGVLTDLLGDAERDVKQFAANALTHLPEASEDHKRVWIRSILAALRDKVLAEKNATVLQAMVNLLVACGRESGLLDVVIGTVNGTLDTLGLPVPAAEEFRANALLTVLPEIAADARAAPAQWLSACETLYRHDKRAGLRHVLESHNALGFGKDNLRNADEEKAALARSAMRYLLLAGLMKPARESWQPAEVEDLWQAFDKLQPGDRLPESIDEPRFRLLRLDALVAVGKAKDVIALAEQYLGEQDPKDHQPLDARQKDMVRLLAAEAYLQDGKIDKAAEHLGRIDPAHATEPRVLEASEKLGRAYLPVDAARASAWLSKVVSATAEDDPAFRGRFVAMLQAKIKANPAQRDEVLELLDRKAAMFEAPDCPEELKEAVQQLKGSRSQ